MAGDLVIDASQLVALGAKLNGASGIVTQKMGTAMQRATLAVQREAQTMSPVKTGTLRRSITAEATPTLGKVGTNLKYARAVHDGRGEVRPVNARVLHWIGSDGTSVFSMRSGPTKPQPFLRNALEQTRPQIVREFQLIGKEIAASLGL